MYQKFKGGLFIENYEFTYWDYLKCIGKYDELSIEDGQIVYTDFAEKTLSVCEEVEEYKIDNDIRKSDKKHDKIFKTIFQSKKEMANFLNHFLELNINSNELELQNPNFITKNYKYNQADILYKLKDREIYYLIEQQTCVDYSMSYRILNYCVETIRLATEDKIINNKYYKFPKVIPIVLYIGNNKWTASTSFADCEVNYPELNFNSLDTKFKLIDINNFEINDLLKLRTMVANTMILEKCKNNDEVIENLNKIRKNLANKKSEIKELKRIISYLYSDMKNIKDIINLIEESEVNETMSTVAERLREEYINKELEGISKGMTQGIAQGISQGISQIIKNMLNYNVPEKDIMKYAKINKEQFEKIKKEFENEKQ